MHRAIVGGNVMVRLSCLLLILGSIPVAAGTQQGRMKVVLDTDIGTDIDDAWALAYAVQSPAFNLLGVTVSDADTEQRAKLACKLLHRLGRTDVPVAIGRRTAAIPADRIDYQFAWAEDFREYNPIVTAASDFLAGLIRRYPGEITVVAVGPLQNLGDLIRRHPDVVPLVKRVVLMSGSIAANAYGPGPVPEWNVKVAIPDAQLVYAAGWPLTIVPLDSTSYVRLSDEERGDLVKIRTPLTIALETLLRLWSERPDSRMTLHDQLAIAEAQSPGRFFARTPVMSLKVDDAGYTRVDPAGRPVTVCLEPKRDEFMQHFLSQLSGHR